MEGQEQLSVLSVELAELRARLADVEQRLARERALHEHAYDGVLLAGASPPHAIEEANARACRLLGVAESELRGLAIDSLVVGADVPRLREVVERARANAGAAAVMRLRPNAGPPVPVRIAAVELALDDERTILAIALSTLEGLGSERADAWMRRAVEELPLGLVVLDEHDRPLDWNPAAAALVGDVDRSVVERWARDWPALPEAVESARRGQLTSVRGNLGRSLTLEVAVFPLHDEDGRARRVGLLVADRTVEAELRRERRALERRLAAIFDAIGDALVVTNARGAIEAWNAAAEKLYGWPRDHAIGRDFRALVEEQTEVSVGGRSSLEMVDGQTWVGRVAHRDRRGGTIEVDVVMRGLVNAAGALDGRVMVCRPCSITGELDEGALRAERLQALESLAGGIAHEFNNLLGVILGNATFLAAHLKDKELADAVSETAAAARRGAELTHRMMAFARGIPSASGHAELRAAIHAVRDALGSEGRLGLVLELDLPPEPVPVRADAAQLQQALLHVVLNAREAMHGRGTIKIAVVVHREAREVEIIVDDQGRGVPKRLRKQIFDPFFTTKAPGEGTGLGLSLVHGLVVGRWGGRIDVGDSPLGGARFVITLPLGHEDPPSTVRPAPSARRVLVVDDEPAVRAAAGRLLRLLGAEVLTTGSAEEMRQRLRAAPFDLVVLDVVMPGATGDELYRELRADFPELPVLFVSGYPAGKLEAVLGSDPRTLFLPKPFDLEALTHAYHTLLGS